MRPLHNKHDYPVISLDAARSRRHHIALALANEDWQQTTASFALEGLPVTEADSERAGRILSGDITLEQALALVHFFPGEET